MQRDVTVTVDDSGRQRVEFQLPTERSFADVAASERHIEKRNDR